MRVVELNHCDNRPVRRGCQGCRSTPPETAGIDFYSGFRKNGQGGGGANQNPKNPGIDFHSGLRKMIKGGGGADVK